MAEVAMFSETGWFVANLISKLVLKGLSIFEDSMKERFVSPLIIKLVLKGLKGKLENLHITVLQIKQVIEKTEMLGSEDDKQLMMVWLRKLQDAAYDADDVLDEYDYELLERQSAKGKFAKAVISPLLSFSSDASFRSKLEDCLEKLDKIASLVGNFTNMLGASSRASSLVYETTYSFVPPERHIFGRDRERAIILDLLINNHVVASGSDYEIRDVPVLPIVGMGGVGKTALAQNIYNSPEIIYNFPIRMWIHTPQNFDEIIITRTMVQSVHPDADHTTDDFATLQQRLQKGLHGKRFLLVLDDVWYDEKQSEYVNRERWRELLAPLRCGLQGSVILITSRIDLGDLMFNNAMKPIRLEGLDEHDCSLILNRYAFEAAAFGQQRPLENEHHLMEIGREIARKIVSKLGGLPLAAKVMGGMLRNKHDVEEWNKVLKIDIWDDITRVLALSYKRLPPLLRLCVAHHGLYPKGFSFSGHYLVRSWIAEGFISAAQHDEQQESGDQSMEEIGSNCLNELVFRSFFQRRHDGRFMLHDLMHDVADSVSRHECIRIQRGEKKDIRPTTKHLCIHVEYLDEYKEKICRLRNLRTLLVLCDSESESNLDHGVLNSILKKSKRLRTLDLAGCRIDKLPDSIGDLKHLRFLDLSGCTVKTLPKSLHRLYHLLYLDLPKCTFHGVPKGLSELVNLRHLDADGTTISMIPSIGRPTALQELEFHVKKEKGHEALQELKEFHAKKEKGHEALQELEFHVEEKGHKEKGHEALQELEFHVEKGHKEKGHEALQELEEFHVKKKGQEEKGHEVIQELKEFHVKKEKGHEARQLKNLANLRGTLHIPNLENIIITAECSQSSLFFKGHSNLEEKLQAMVQTFETESLSKIKAVKEEAEMRQGENQSLVQWLREIQEILCEAEDVLDEFKYNHLEQKVLKKQHAYLRFIYTYNSYAHYKSKVEAVLERLHHIASKVDDFIQLLSSDLDINNNNNAFRPPARITTTSESNEELLGREEEMYHVLDLLLSSVGSDEQHFLVLPIIGVGGVGKTVFAKSVYHHEKITNHFHQRMWVHLPQDFDEAKVTVSMIECISSTHNTNTENLDALQVELSNLVKGNRFLLVLDDVWYDEKRTEFANKVRWRRLCAPLSHGSQGSMILITTRMELVAKTFCSSTTTTKPPVLLKGLGEDACFALFNKYAFGVDAYQQKRPDDELLQEIGKEIVADKIVAELGGLPLAAKVVGVMLRESLDAETWNHVLRSDSTFDDVVKALTVSYQHLPRHLQRCVAHHSIFPRGMALPREYLVHAWIAGGLIIDSTEEKNDGMTEEDIASVYLDELVARSFFQSRDDDLFVLHDLMHDVADSVTKDVCIRIEANTNKEIPPTIQHLRIDVEKLGKYKKKICRLKNLRTLVLTCKSSGVKVHVDRDLLGDIIKKTKRLRVLRLASCHIDQLPEWISDLEHLRLLDLSNMQVEKLPRSVLRRLYHLLYLDLTNFKADSMPRSLSNLISLKRIMSDAATLDRFGNIGKLTALQQLPGFSIKKMKKHKIGQLKNLSKLQGELRISNLQNVRSSGEAAGAKLKEKAHLHKLHLEWASNDKAYGVCTNDDPVPEQVLDQLQPPHQINLLRVMGYAGKRPPIWMRCPDSPLFLQVLILDQWVGTLPVLDQWIPHLNQLELRSCSKLRCLPPLPHSLEKLLLSGCYSLAILTEEDLVPSFDSRPAIEVEEGIKRSLVKNDRVMTELERVKHSLEARGFTLDPSDSILTSLQAWGLSRKLEAIREKLTTKTPSINGDDAQLLPSSLRQLHLDNCFVDDSELLKCIRRLTLLTHLVLASCYCITIPPSEEVLSQLSQLQELQIEDCVMLTSLGGLRALQSLRVLNISSCPNLLAPIPSNNVDKNDDDDHAGGGGRAFLPESLVDLTITDCELLDGFLISRCLIGLNSLNNLSLQQLERMISLPSATDLMHLKSLQCLTLKDCEKLESLGDLHVVGSLHWLLVHHCPGLLKSVDAEGSLSVPNANVDDLSLLPALLSKEGLASLQDLSIINQSTAFTTEQEKCLQQLSSLQRLSFKNCESIPSLPSNLECLTCLKRLDVDNCPQINSIATLPMSLQIINLKGCHPQLEQRYSEEGLEGIIADTYASYS